MRDWIGLVKSRLGPLGLNPQREAEVLAELAGHLEDLTAGLRKAGLSEEEALQRAQDAVPDWAMLRQRVRSVEKGGSFVGDVRKHVWLPGVYSLGIFFLCVAVIGLFFRLLYEGGILLSPDWRAQVAGASMWCFMLTGLGAGAAWWSKRAGGSRRERMLAALFLPTVVTMVSLVVFLVSAIGLSLVLDAYYVGRFALFGILLPAAVLIMGAIPFLRPVLS